MPSHLLKSTPVEATPPVVVLPPNIVEIELEGEMEQVDVHYEFPIITSEECVTPINDPCSVEEPKTDNDPSCSSSSIPVKTGKRSNKLLKKGGKEGDLLAASILRKSHQEQETKLKLPEPDVKIIDDYYIDDAPARPNNAYIRYIERTPEELAETVEYDLDELDVTWLESINEKRAKERVQPVAPEVMEFIMDRLEKESYFQMQSSGIEQGPVIDDDAVCCICMDGECQNANAILFCDMCNLAVHQECYGVPYIPEGQWLCRRCYLSPSIAVDCVLCPNKGGAFKQTECKRWAHVVCAIWIPEVCFANTVFLEPIDNINSIPPARWRLCCFICKQKGVGACIQCYKSNCYIAFHVTCAQQAGLCMRMETVKISKGVTVKKTAYCDTHAPPDFIAERDNGSPTARQKLKKIRKVLAEKRCAPPVVSVPTITAEQLSQISSAVNVTKKAPFMKTVISYWKLKRMSRNGVPLLRRLQVASNTSNSVNKSSRKIDISQSEMKDYAMITRLRQDLEKSRLLCELTRKREKLKRDDIYLKCQNWDMRIQPCNYFLASIVDEVISKDTQSIFTQPVDPEHVPDYLTIVTNPIDLSTIRKKIFEFEYATIDDLQKDFQLMIDNCMLYNSPDTVFYRAALKMQEFGGVVFREAKRRHEAIGFLPSGIMTETPPSEYHAKPVIFDETRLAEEIEGVLENKSRYDLSHEEHISLLEQTLDKSLNLSQPLSRKKKYLRVMNEIIRLKKRKKLLESGGSGGGDISSMDEDEVVPSPSIFGAEIADSSEGEEGESGAKSFIPSVIRRRLRSTENEPQQLQQIQNQPNRLSRRMSRSSELMARITSVSPDILNMEAGASYMMNPEKSLKSASPVVQRPRGRPPKTLSSRGRGGRARLAVRGAGPTVRQQRQLQSPRRGGFRGRPRGRRGVRPVRRSVRVVKQQIAQRQSQNTSSSPEKEGEQHQHPSSRHGSPTGRNSSPRLSRNTSPTHQNSPKNNQISSSPEGRLSQQQRRKISNRQPSPILGSPIKPHQMYMLKKPPTSQEAYPSSTTPKPVRGRPSKKSVPNITRAKLNVLSPKTMEAAAKSIICEDRLSPKRKLAVAKGAQLRKLLEAETGSAANEVPEKKITRGGAIRLAKRNPNKKDTNLTDNLNSSPTTNRVLPQRKARGPAAAVGRRKKAVTQPNGPQVHSAEIEEHGNEETGQEEKNNLLPITNGLPMVGSPTKQGSPGKKRMKRGAPDAPTPHSPIIHPTGSYAAMVDMALSQPSPAVLHLRKSDSFSVYRSGGDHDINSCSEGESGNDEDEEDEEMEEEEGEEDEDDEEEGELDDEDDSGSEEEPGKPSGPQQDGSSEEEDDDDEDGDGEGDKDEDSSGSDDSSSDDSDSSSTSSSTLSSSSSGSTASKASSSSSITTPKHFHPTKNKKRRSSGNANAGYKQVQQSTAPPPRPRQQFSPPINVSIIPPVLNNNNNDLYNNKERAWDILHGRHYQSDSISEDEEDPSANLH